MHLIKEMAESGVAALSLDSIEFRVDLAQAAEKVPKDVAVIGNISPTRVLKDGSVETVRDAVTILLKRMKPYKNFILSTGCDVPPQTPIENLTVFMQTAREFK